MSRWCLQQRVESGWNASGIVPAFVSIFPELVDDSFATIGLDGPSSLAGPNAVEPVLAETGEYIEEFFTIDGSTGFELNTVIGVLGLR